jgi:capsular exopolysaccharide synthesis family protein
MSKVAEEVGMGYSADYIKNTVSASAVSETEVLRISVRNPNPQHAQLIADAVAKYAPAEIMRVVNAGHVEVIDKAKLPKYPSYPNVRQGAIQWGAVGLVLACVIILLKELLDTRIKSEEDLRQVTEVPVVGVIPSTYKKKKGKPARAAAVLTKSSPPIVHEAYRAARTNLLFTLSGKLHGRVMITSASPSEGKTTTCANLAITFAQANKTVLMIDCDMRSPGLNKLFSLNANPGLSDILGGFSDYSCVVQTTVDNLSLLPAGTVPPNPAELLVSPAFDELLEYFSGEYDYIIVDTPPSNMFSDSISISGKFDGVILVTKYAWTRKERIRHMFEQFEKVSAKIIGVVINDFETKSYTKQFGAAGGGKYYNKYGYGSDVGESGKK